MFKFKPQNSNNTEWPAYGIGNSSADRRAHEASLARTREAMAEYEKEKAQGAVALEGAEVMPVAGQLDPSHEITAHAQQQDTTRAIAEADAADKVASGHLTTV